LNHPNALSHARNLFKQGQTDLALVAAMKAPNSPERSRLMLSILFGRRRPADMLKAMKIIEKWKRLDRTAAEPWARQFEVHVFNKQYPLAQKVLNELGRRDPRSGNTYYYQGLLLQLSGNLEKALTAYRKSVIARHKENPVSPPPTDAATHALAVIKAYQTATGSYPGAQARVDPHLLDQPDLIQLMMEALTRWDEEIQSTDQVLRGSQVQTLATAWSNLGLASLGTEQSAEYFGKALELNPEHVLARENALFVLNYSTRLSRREIFKRHLRSAEYFQSLSSDEKPAFKNDPAPKRKLKIAYLSSDFRQHPVAHFILPVIESHDPGKVDVYTYYNQNSEDELTRRVMQSSFRFRNIKKLEDAELAEQIINDRVDILIDLGGHAGSGRMSVFASRAAPIQITWIGYPNTTGLENMDYRIVDETTDPRPQSQDFCTEELLYMPRIFSVYASLDELPPVTPAPGIESGIVTFGSFNNMAKVTDSLLNSWGEVLNRVPGSRLLIKDYAMNFKFPRKRILNLLNSQGIRSDRIELLGYSRDKLEHMQTYQKVDICLDSYPYNGTTTTCDSLIMGVPVITRAGEDHRSRVSASQLGALGLDSLVTANEQKYIERATELALNPDKLQSVRKGLRERMQSSPLMDAAGFTRDLESAYQQVWRTWCDRQTT
jgi:protein O-GlcNAc transferase